MPVMPTSQNESAFRDMPKDPKGTASKLKTHECSVSQHPDWNTEEMLETTLDKDGNPVPDAWAFTDGVKMTKHTKGPAEADAYEAATEDFD